jgi:hypothetical protein
VVKIQVHRKGLAAVLGILVLVVLVGPVQTVAVLRAVTVVLVLVAFGEIVLHFVRNRELRIQSRIFSWFMTK